MLKLTIAKNSLRNYLFFILVFYYLLMNYVIAGEITKFSLEYFLFVIPILVYIVLNGDQIATKHYSTKSLILLCFFLLVLIVSLIRQDVSTVLTIFLFCATLIVIFNSRIVVSIRLINLLFMLSILGSVISYHAGTNIFGYLPKFASVDELFYGGVGWRISLFPLIPESSFFSLLVIVANYYLNRSRSRFLFYGLGFYFLIFSGSRTSLVIFIFFVAFVIVTKLFTFRRRMLYQILSPLMILTFILLLSFKSILLLIKDTRIAFLNEYIFRTEEGLAESTKLEDVATRTWIWSQHFKIYSEGPIFGVGTYDFDDYKENPVKAYQQSTGSESFLTGLIARVGLLALLVVFMVYRIQQEGIDRLNPFVYVLSFYIFITMISYGSFMVPYNFMFLLIFGTVNTTQEVRGN